MAQIKIRSNPYLKKIIYEYYDDSLGRYVEINYKNNPNCKLIGESYKSTFIVNDVGNILEAIYDTYYNRDEKIRILFEGTKEELDALLNASKEYGSEIVIIGGEQNLIDEKEVLDLLENFNKNLQLNVKTEEYGSVYQKINSIRIVLEKYYYDKKKELEALNVRFDELNNLHDTNVSLLIKTIQHQYKKKDEENDDKENYKKEIEEIVEKYVKNYVLDKNTLEMKYDKIKDEKFAIITEKNEKRKNENLIDKKIEKNQIMCNEEILNGVNKVKTDIVDVVGEGEKVLNNTSDRNPQVKKPTKIGDFFIKATKFIKTDVEANKEADKAFLEHINDLYANSFQSIIEEMRNDIFKEMSEKSIEIQKYILEIISKNSTDEIKESINKSLSELSLTDASIFIPLEIGECKFKNFDVNVHIPGIPNLSAIRNEWASELKKYIEKNIENFKEIEKQTLSEWQEKVVNEIKGNIIKFNPNVKSQIDVIDELRIKKNKVEEDFNIVKEYYDKFNKSISFK